MELIRKIEEFNGPKKWLKDWENRERQKSDIERKNEKELCSTIVDAVWFAKWERAKVVIENGTKFDHVDSGGRDAIYWLLERAYYTNSGEAERIWKEIKEETKKEEIEKNWTTLMVMENYWGAAWFISWTNSTILVAESKMPILNTLLVKNQKERGKLILDDEKISKIINGIGEKVGGKINAELNAIGAKNLFENNYDFFEKFILAKSNPVYWLILLSRGNGWKPEFTKKILEKLDEKILPNLSVETKPENKKGLITMFKGILPKNTPKLDAKNETNLKSIFNQNENISFWIEWLANLKNPILNFLSLTNEIGWTDELAKKVLDKIENKIEVIQNDLNFIAEIDQIGHFSTILTNFIIFGEKTKLFDGLKILADFDHPPYFLFLLSKEKEWTENIFDCGNLLERINNPIYFLHILSDEKDWSDDLTKNFLKNFGKNNNQIIQENLRFIEQNEQIQKYSDVLIKFIIFCEKNKYYVLLKLIGNWLLDKKENPIYFLLLLTKTSGWTDTLTELLLGKFGENFQKILEDDIKFMTEKRYLNNVENELLNLVSFAKRLNLFKNKYFDSEPLTWQYAHGSNRRFLAAFFKDLNISDDLIAHIENGNLKVILTYKAKYFF